MQMPPPPEPLVMPKLPKGSLGLIHRVTVRSLDDEEIKHDSGYVRSRSWVKNFPRILATNFNATVGVNNEWGSGDADGGIRNMNGSWLLNNATYNTNYDPLLVEGTAANDLFGIQVGTDNTAPKPTDYALGGKISHGTGAGQLNYGAGICVSTIFDGSTYDLLLWRPFGNESGGNITVQEIGLYGAHYYTTTSSYFLIARDLLNFTVNDGEVGTVEYVVRLS